MTRIPWRLGWLAPLALAACVTQQPKPQDSVGKVSPQMRSGSTELRSYQIADWIAPDDRTLILNAMDRSLYEGRFKGQCTGLRLVDTIAFIVPGPQQADRYSGVVLPDGRRCAFKSFTRLTTQPAEDAHQDAEH
jgi:hypothetical protein